MIRFAMPIRVKVPVALIGLSLLVAALTLYLGYLTERSLAAEDAESQLTRISGAEMSAIRRWYRNAGEDLTSMAANPMTAKSLAQLRSIVRDMGDTAYESLRDKYSRPAGQPAPTPSEPSVALSAYMARHDQLNDYVERVIARLAYADVLLITTSGDILYTYAKEKDFGTNLTTGSFRDSRLADVFNRAMTMKPGEFAVADYQRYGAAGNVPAMFMATPVADNYGGKAGVLAIRIPTSSLERVVKDNLGGVSYVEAIVAGSDGLIRAGKRDSALTPLAPSTYLTDSDYMARNMGDLAHDVQLQSGGIGFAKAQIMHLPGGIDWTFALEIRKSDAMAGATRFFRRSLTYGTGALLFVGAAGLLLARSITQPVHRLAKSMALIGGGDLSTPVADLARRDEVGEMALALDDLRIRLASAQAEEARQQLARDAADEAVDRLRVALREMSVGDLTLRLDAAFPPELDRLRTDFNHAVAQVSEVMADIVHSASAIDRAARDSGTAAADLSRRTEAQAATLEQTAAAMDELTNSVRSSAEAARHAAKITQDAKAEADQSGGVVTSAVAAMNEIEISSRHIIQIIGVIDEIAFQTSLLALNAGVEAARAGDAGRGFAVVASEVRALAQRSSSAAKEIKALIAVSGQQVEIGVARVAETGASLQRIVTRVDEIAALVSGIARAAAEQASGLSEVNTGVIQLDAATQQNAAMAAEAEANNRSMAHEAALMQALVARFKTLSPVGTRLSSADAGFSDQTRLLSMGLETEFTPVPIALPPVGGPLPPGAPLLFGRAGAAPSLAQWHDF